MESDITSLHGEINEIEQNIVSAESAVREGYVALARARVQLIKARCEQAPLQMNDVVDLPDAGAELLSLWHEVLHSRRDPYTISKSVPAAPGWVFRIQSDWVEDASLGGQVTQARISLEPEDLDSDETTSGMPRQCMPVAQTLIETLNPLRIDQLRPNDIVERLSSLVLRTSRGAVEPPEIERLGGSGE